MTTPVLFSAKQKELASLKQLFVLNAPKSTSASRQKSEANLGCNIASLVAVAYFLLENDISVETLVMAFRAERKISKTSASSSKAHLIPFTKGVWGGVKFRHLVEERKENRADFREEQKAV